MNEVSPGAGSRPCAAFAAVLQRKDPKLPVYVVVPNALVASWGMDATTVIEGMVNGQTTGRRSMKRLSKAQDSDWFVEFTAPFCRLAGIGVGDHLAICLWPGIVNLPDELEALLRTNSGLRLVWNGLSEYQRRTSTEHIRAGKTEATRVRRARKLLFASLALTPPTQSLPLQSPKGAHQ